MFEGQEHMLRFAEYAYARCVEWFGSPEDAEWPYRFIPWHKSMCVRLPFHLDPCYAIFLDTQTSESEDYICDSIAHEMYHRVTFARPGLLKEMWVDEMMGCLVSQQLLQEHGREDYAYAMEQSSLDDNHSLINIAQLRQLRLKRRLFEIRRKSTYYPKNFSEEIIRLGAALRTVVGWEALCKIVEAPTLMQWIATLPHELHSPVCTILDVLPEEISQSGECAHIRTDVTLSTAQDHYKFGEALNWKGDFAAAIRELKEALRLDRDDIPMRFELSIALYHSGQVSEAIVELREILRFLPDEFGVHFTLANYLRKQGDLDAAIHHFETSLQIQPNDAGAHYYLGLALNDQGKRTEARARWNTALQMDDDIVTRQAQEALEQYP
jgi:tetratricopeptide (TPR) repeat protein